MDTSLSSKSSTEYKNEEGKFGFKVTLDEVFRGQNLKVYFEGANDGSSYLKVAYIDVIGYKVSEYNQPLY